MIDKRTIVVTLALVAAFGMVALAHAPPQGPVIEAPVIQPASPGPGDIVTIAVNVTDAQGVQNVTIVYTTDNWQTNASITASYNATTGTATAQMPSFPMGGHVVFYVVAFDTNGNRSVNDNNGAYFAYDAPAAAPVSVTTFAFVGVLAAVGAAVGIMAYVMWKHRPPTSAKVSSRTGTGQF